MNLSELDISSDIGSDEELQAMSTISGAKDSIALQRYLLLRKDSKHSISGPLSSAAHSNVSWSPLQSVRKPLEFESPKAHDKSDSNHLTDSDAMKVLLKTALGEKSELSKKVQSDEKMLAVMKTNLAVASTSTQKYSMLLRVANRSVLPRFMLYMMASKVYMHKSRAFSLLVQNWLNDSKMEHKKYFKHKIINLLAVISKRYIKRFWEKWRLASHARTIICLHRHHDAVVMAVLAPRLLSRLFKRWRTRILLKSKNRKYLRRVITRRIRNIYRLSFDKWCNGVRRGVSMELSRLRLQFRNSAIANAFVIFSLKRKVESIEMSKFFLKWKAFSDTYMQREQKHKRILLMVVKRMDNRLMNQNEAFQKWKRFTSTFTKIYLRVREYLGTISNKKQQVVLFRRFQLWKLNILKQSNHRQMLRQSRIMTLQQVLSKWKQNIIHCSTLASATNQMRILSQLNSMLTCRDKLRIRRRFSTWTSIVLVQKLIDDHNASLSGVHSTLAEARNECAVYSQNLQKEVDVSQELAVNLFQLTRSTTDRSKRVAMRLINTYVGKKTSLLQLKGFNKWKELIHFKLSERREQMVSVIHRMTSIRLRRQAEAFQNWKLKINRMNEKFRLLASHWMKGKSMKLVMGFAQWKAQTVQIKHAQYTRWIRNNQVVRTVIHQLQSSMRLAFNKWKTHPHIPKQRMKMLDAMFMVISKQFLRFAFSRWKREVCAQREEVNSRLSIFFKNWKRYLVIQKESFIRIQSVLTKLKRVISQYSFRKWHKQILLSRTAGRVKLCLQRVSDRSYESALQRGFSLWVLFLLRTNSVNMATQTKKLQQLRKKSSVLEHQIVTADKSYRCEVEAKDAMSRRSQYLEKVANRLLQLGRGSIKRRQRFHLLRKYFFGWQRVYLQMSYVTRLQLSGLFQLVSRHYLALLSKSFHQLFLNSNAVRIAEDRAQLFTVQKLSNRLRKSLMLWVLWSRSRKIRRIKRLDKDAQTTHNETHRRTIMDLHKRMSSDRILRWCARYGTGQESNQLKRSMIQWLRFVLFERTLSKGKYSKWFTAWKVGVAVRKESIKRRDCVLRHILHEFYRQLLAAATQRWRHACRELRIASRKQFLLRKLVHRSSTTIKVRKLKNGFHRWKVTCVLMKSAMLRWMKRVDEIRCCSLSSAFLIWKKLICNRRTKEQVCNRALILLISKHNKLVSIGFQRWRHTVHVLAVKLRICEYALKQRLESNVEQNQKAAIAARKYFSIWRMRLNTDRVLLRLNQSISDTIVGSQRLVSEVLKHSWLPVSEVELDEGNDHNPGYFYPRWTHNHLLYLLASSLDKFAAVLGDRQVRPTVLVGLGMRGDVEQLVGLTALHVEEARLIFDCETVEQMVFNITADSKYTLLSNVRRDSGLFGRCLLSGRSVLHSVGEWHQSHFQNAESCLCSIANAFWPLMHCGRVVGLIHFAVGSVFSTSLSNAMGFRDITDNHLSKSIRETVGDQSHLKEMGEAQLLREVCLQLSLSMDAHTQLLTLLSALPAVLGGHLTHAGELAQMLSKKWTQSVELRREQSEAQSRASAAAAEVFGLKDKLRSAEDRVQHLVQSRSKVVAVSTQLEQELKQSKDIIAQMSQEMDKYRSALKKAHRKLKEFDNERNELMKVHDRFQTLDSVSEGFVEVPMHVSNPILSSTATTPNYPLYIDPAAPTSPRLLAVSLDHYGNTMEIDFEMLEQKALDRARSIMAVPKRDKSYSVRDNRDKDDLNLPRTYRQDSSRLRASMLDLSSHSNGLSSVRSST